MSTILLSALTETQKEQIYALHSSFPLDDAELIAIYETDGRIRSAAVFLSEDETTWECFAYTEPSFRRQGLFTELLDLAIDELPEDTEFIFYTNGSDADCMATLNALEAEPILEEHMMELDLASFAASFSSETSAPKSECFSVKEKEIDQTCTRCYESAWGVVNISVFSSYYYLYGLEIKEELRGQGYGRTFLLQVLSDLAAIDPMPLRLQVSGENIPALSLYKKTGFQITETLFGYLY